MEGFIALRLSLCLTLLVKNCGLEPFHTFCNVCAPWRFLLVLIFMSMYVTDPGKLVFLFSVLAGSAMGLTLNLLPFSPQPLMVENNGVEPLTSCVQGRRSSQLS